MSEIDLYWENETGEQEVYERAREIVEQNRPFLCWLEPRPSPKNGVNSCLREDFPEDSLILDEIRLFYADRMVHIIATPGGYRLFQCSEKEVFREKKQVKKAPTRKLLLQRDWSRFGMEREDRDSSVTVIEYFYKSSLFAWRIIPKGG